MHQGFFADMDLLNNFPNAPLNLNFFKQFTDADNFQELLTKVAENKDKLFKF